MSEYRDPRTGLLEHIADADRAIGERSSRMTAALRHLLPKELAERITELEAVPAPRDASVAELARFVEICVALVEALDEALARAPKLEASLTATRAGVPAAPPQADLWGPAGTEEAMAEHRMKVETFVRANDPGGSVDVRGARITARMSVDGVPILWVIEFSTGINTSRGLSLRIKFLRAKHVVEANAPKELPRLLVRPHTLGDSLRELFGAKRHVEQGEREFDRRFHIEGDAAFVRPLLGAEMRQRLDARADAGDFELTLDGGLLKLAWGRAFEPLVDMETAGISARTIATLRQAATSFALVTGHER